MRLLYVMFAAILSYVCLVASASLAMIIGIVLDMSPEVFSVLGIVIILTTCITGIVWINGMSIESSGDYLKPKAVIVWLPALLGLLFSIISTLTILGGLWMAMTFAIMNVYRRNWERDHLKVEGDGHHHRSKN